MSDQEIHTHSPSLSDSPSAESPPRAAQPSPSASATGSARCSSSESVPLSHGPPTVGLAPRLPPVRLHPHSPLTILHWIRQKAVLRGGADGARDEKAWGRGWARAGSLPGTKHQVQVTGSSQSLGLLPAAFWRLARCSSKVKSCARACSFGPRRVLRLGAVLFMLRSGSKLR
jgi:hypothetical protein